MAFHDPAMDRGTTRHGTSFAALILAAVLAAMLTVGLAANSFGPSSTERAERVRLPASAPLQMEDWRGNSAHIPTAK